MPVPPAPLEPPKCRSWPPHAETTHTANAAATRAPVNLFFIEFRPGYAIEPRGTRVLQLLFASACGEKTSIVAQEVTCRELADVAALFALNAGYDQRARDANWSAQLVLRSC